MARNTSLQPDLQMTVTNAIVRRFNSDGTLAVEQNTNADSELDVTITNVYEDRHAQQHSDILVTAQYQLTIQATATYVNRKLGRKIFENYSVVGTTRSSRKATFRRATPGAAPGCRGSRQQHGQARHRRLVTRAKIPPGAENAALRRAKPIAKCLPEGYDNVMAMEKESPPKAGFRNPISPEELLREFPARKLVTYDAGTFIFAKAPRRTNCYFITQGSVRILKEAARARTCRSALVKAGRISRRNGDALR